MQTKPHEEITDNTTINEKHKIYMRNYMKEYKKPSAPASPGIPTGIWRGRSYPRNCDHIILYSLNIIKLYIYYYIIFGIVFNVLNYNIYNILKIKKLLLEIFNWSFWGGWLAPMQETTKKIMHEIQI
jgi:hypothetical protein